MKLSIVIPVYRVEDTLDRCVESVLCQDVPDMEVILVDDGSPDCCPQLCDRWAISDARISVIHQRNDGLSAARNAGIEQAKGDYITFVDSDDFLAPNTYQPLIQQLTEQPDIDILEYPLCWHAGAADQRIVSFGYQTYDNANDYWLLAHAYEHTYAWNKIYRRQLFQNVRYPVGRVYEDVAALPLLLQHARKVATTTCGLYHYCWNAAGITATASGRELTMLLDHHLTVMTQPQMLCDDRYYLHVLNTQMDVCELTDQPPRLPFRYVSPLTRGLSFKARLKAITLNLLGIQRLCILNKTLHRIIRSHS